MPSTNSVQDALLKRATARGPQKSFCPSEVSRELWPDEWRSHMDDVRMEAGRMIAAGILACTQGGTVVDIETATGPIRLTLKV